MAHVEIIQNRRSTLLRCININVLIVAGLREVGVIDDAIESRLKAEKAHHDKLCLLIDWIKESPDKIYESFLQVMDENEQQHVANLLRGKEDDNHLPLSIARYSRLLKIRRTLMSTIHNNVALIAALKSSRAITEADVEDLSVGNVPNYKKNFQLINAILRRSDYSFECLHDALRDTHQTDAADYLMEGEVIRVHANTTRPDLDEEMAESINTALLNESMDETTVKEIEIPHMNGLRLVGATPGNSIVIFVYCKTIDNMVTFTQLFNSGELKTKLEDFLNRLFARIEPKSTEILGARISLEDEDVLEIEETTGIEDWTKTEKTKSTESGCLLTSQKPTEAEQQTSKEVVSNMDRCCCCGRGGVIDPTNNAPGHVFECQHFMYKDRLENIRETRLQSICSLCRTPSVVDSDGSSVDRKPRKDSYGRRVKAITTSSIPDDGSMKKRHPDSLIYESNLQQIATRLSLIGDDSSDIPATRKQLDLMAYSAGRYLKNPTGTMPLADLTMALYQKKNELEAAEKVFGEQGTQIRNRIEKHAHMNRALAERDEKRLLLKLDGIINDTVGKNCAAISSIFRLIQRLEKADEKDYARTDDLEKLMTTRINTTQFTSFNLSLNNIRTPGDKNVVGELQIELIKDHSSFLTTPVLIGSIPADDRHKAVTGVTTLDREIFITRDNFQDISVYAVITNEYLRSLSLLNLPKLITSPSPVDLAACCTTRTLYVADESNECVYRLRPDGELVHWWMVENLRGLSVTTIGTVLVGSGRAVREYDPSGHLIQTIGTSLFWSFFRDREQPSIKRPMHFLEANDGRIVVCDFPASDASRSLHVVYGVSRWGSPVGSWHGKRAESGDEFLNEPRHLAVDVTGHVMIADRRNDRVKLLDAELKFVRDLMGPEHWIKRPQRLHYDPVRGLLYVGLVAGDTLVFKVTL